MNTLILSRVVLPSVIFGIAVFWIEKTMQHANDAVWVIVLGYGMIPTALLYRIFDLQDPGIPSALSQWSTVGLAVNAIFYSIPVTLIAWLITKGQKP
jgi:hypothetical protein